MYKIDNSIRKMIVFAVQNLINDPPFTNLDLLCCRNLLIYLTTPLQNKILSLFYSSLNASGLLFIGPSESIGSAANYFDLIDHKWRLYECKKPEFLIRSSTDLSSTHQSSTIIGVNMKENTTHTNELRLAGLVKDLMVSNYTPAFIIIDDKGDIVYVYGRTSQYLELPFGEARLHFMNMIRPELKSTFHVGIHKAFSQQKEIVLNGLKITPPQNDRYINVKISPIQEPDGTQPALLLIVIEEIAAPESLLLSKNGSYPHVCIQPDPSKKTALLTDELKHVKQHFQNLIEEMEASNEELRSINEEAQATNEELQFLNEGLTIINTKLENHIEYLSNEKLEISAVLEHTDIPTIVLDKNLCIKRYTPKATQIVNLIPSDLGRPINHLASTIQNNELFNNIRTTFHTMEAIETTGIDVNGNSYLIRATPFRLPSNIDNSVVITFLSNNSPNQDEEKIKIHKGSLT